MGKITANNQKLWDIVKELDDAVKVNNVTDWELNFISSIMDQRTAKRSYSPKQVEHILRLREKYVE